ncbi:MAG TPA: DUF1549 domain-containing protein [Gemmataceae bacterium]|nr:DUF1549 domain-containing protein [Gemmataceae bacterium]
MMVGRGLNWSFCAVLVAMLIWFPSFTAKAADGGTPKAQAPTEREVAQRLDHALLQGHDPAVPLPPPADDEAFLRRVSLDLVGKLPNADAIDAFVADADPEKRAKQIEHLLRSEAFAVNWSRYWRDTLTYHTPASGNYLRWKLFDEWMVDQFRRNRPWGEIVRALVTATGINDECAPVNYLTALYGNPVEIAATTSRVFLGVQLQCAQCHNARTEPWKREQFHELVAFFGRAKIIQHKDVDGRGTPYAIEGRADGQYSMTDKKDPQHLIVMTPRFLTGESVSLEASDAERRAALAQFLTSPRNPWFARSYVNRMWTALMGWGFYASVNDLGSGPAPRFPEVLDRLAADWTSTGYDIQWLFRTLALTQVYQRHLQPRTTSEALPMLAVCPSRLRPEQIFEALVKALGFSETDKSIPAPAPSSAPAVARHTGLRHMIYQAFKVDPSLPADEVQGTIPQALLMMNSVLVNTFVAAKGKTYLAEALAKDLPDEEILLSLYERTLARKPSTEELAICKRYVQKSADRKEGLEDVFWSLVNSTEFLLKD